MPFLIETPEQRQRLDPRDKPYFQRIGKGLSLGYRKGKTRAAWLIRWQEGNGYRSLTLKGVSPDDKSVSPGVRTMTYSEAVEVAMDQGIYYCSFCNKSSREVAKLVAGPNVYICDGCVELCQHYMREPNAEGRRIKLDASGRAMLDGSGRPVFE